MSSNRRPPLIGIGLDHVGMQSFGVEPGAGTCTGFGCAVDAGDVETPACQFHHVPAASASWNHDPARDK